MHLSTLTATQPQLHPSLYTLNGLLRQQSPCSVGLVSPAAKAAAAAAAPPARAATAAAAAVAAAAPARAQGPPRGGAPTVAAADLPRAASLQDIPHLRRD